MAADLSDEPRGDARASELAGIGHSGGSDIARHKDHYLGEALTVTHDGEAQR